MSNHSDTARFESVAPMVESSPPEPQPGRLPRALGKRFSARTGSIAAGLILVMLCRQHAMALAAPESGEGVNCTSSIGPNPYQQILPPSFVFGFDGTPSYGGPSSQVVPEPIPIGFHSTDTDLVIAHCASSCFMTTVLDNVVADWKVSQLQGSSGAGGALLSPHGYLTDNALNADAVLYVPPKDLPLGGTCTDVVEVNLHDTGAATGFYDQYLLRRIRIETNREDPSGLYKVQAQEEYSVFTPDQPPQCSVDGSNPCRYVPYVEDYLPAWVTIDDYPSEGMTIGQARTIDAYGVDQDRLLSECGTPPGWLWTPSFSNAQIVVNDVLSYTWTVVAGPGFGTFVFQGATAIFEAEQEGQVTLRVTVVGANGESASYDVTFDIRKPQLRRLKYDTAGRLRVIRDKDSTAYNQAEYEWYDKNDDGDADDPQLGTSEADLRYPLAYKLGAQPAFAIAEIRLDNPSYEGALVLADGIVAGNGNQHFEGSAHAIGAGTTNLKADWLYGQPLAQAVQCFADVPGARVGYKLQWKISFRSGNEVDVGVSNNPLYVTLAANGLWGIDIAQAGDQVTLPFESAYFISCKSAVGSGTIQNFRAGLESLFSLRSLKRKPFDGENTVDDTALQYWPSTDCSTAPANTLAGLLSAPDGAGQCYTFAYLFRHCVMVQGETACEALYMTHLYDGGVFLVKNWEPGPPDCVRYIAGPNTDLYDGNGVPAQGVCNPCSMFVNHMLVIWGAELIDPSYGLSFSSQGAHKAACVDFVQSVTPIRSFGRIGACPNGGDIAYQALFPWPQ